MAEYRYLDDAPRCTSAYLWPELLRLLATHAPAPRRLFELGCGNGATARMWPPVTACWTAARRRPAATG